MLTYRVKSAGVSNTNLPARLQSVAVPVQAILVQEAIVGHPPALGNRLARVALLYRVITASITGDVSHASWPVICVNYFIRKEELQEAGE